LPIIVLQSVAGVITKCGKALLQSVAEFTKCGTTTTTTLKDLMKVKLVKTKLLTIPSVVGKG